MFKKQAEQMLETLADYVEAFAISLNNANISCESNFDGDVLEFAIHNTASGQNYNFVINSHEASEKIWYSSPVSRPKYYAFHTQGDQWLESTADSSLLNDLQNDLQNVIKAV